MDFSILIGRLLKTEMSEKSKRFYQTVNEAFFLSVLFFIPVSLVLFDWRLLSYIMLFFFFLATKNFLQNQLDSIAPITERGGE
jgi:hypothetical protein